MALNSNQPTFTYVSWKGLIVHHDGEMYNVKNDHTNLSFIYWESVNPYQLICSRTRLKESASRYLLFRNDKGLATEIPQSNISLSWDGNNEDSIRGSVTGMYETIDGYGEKFVTIETDIEGLKTTVGDIIEGGVGGDNEGVHNAIIERVSAIEQKADSIDLSVKEVTKQFTDNKEINELRENLNKSIIDTNSVLGIFKGEMSSYYKDNKIDTEEKVKIDTHISVLETKVAEVIKYVDVVISMVESQGQTSQANALKSAKTKFTNAISNLKTYINTAISDGTIVPSEITGIIDLFGKSSVAINELKNTCDESIYLGAGGSISEELSRIGIKSDEIVLSVSKTEESIRNDVDLLKVALEGQIKDVDGALKDFENVVNTTFKDGIIDAAEKEILLDRLATLDKEKKDIDGQYNAFYADVNLKEPVKTELKNSYNTYVSKHNELSTKLQEVISDGFVNDAEKNQINTLMTEYATVLADVNKVMNKAIDNISLHKAREEVTQAKNELQGNISDVDNKVTDLDNYVNGTFEDNILDEAERKAIKQNLDTLAREKVDIDNQYTQLNANKFLDGILKTNYTVAYNNFVSKYNYLVDIINGILSKQDLINNTDRNNMNVGYSQLNEVLGVFVKLSNEVIEYIAKKESEYIKSLLDKDIADVDNKINDLTNDINTSFKDNIIDESERTLIATNLKDLEMQKIDVDSQYEQLMLSQYLDGTLKIQFQTKYGNLNIKYEELVKVMNDILAKTDLINNADRNNLNNAKDAFNLSIGEFSRIVNEVIEYIGRKQSESAVGDFNSQLGALNDKVDNIMGDFEGALADGILDDAERISIRQSLKSLENDFIANEIEYQKIYNNINLVGNIKTELNTVFNTYKTKYQSLIDTINYLLNKIGNIDASDRTRLDNAYMQYGEAIRLYLSKFYEAMDSITNKGINDAKNEIGKEINDLNTSLGNLEETMNGVFKDGILSDAEKLAIKQNLQTIELEKVDIDRSYESAYNNKNLIGTPKLDLKNSYDTYITNHNNLVKVINDILNKVGIIDSTDQAKLNTALSQYKSSLSAYRVKYNVAIDSITNKGINDAKNEVQNGINDLNNALGDLENTMNNAFKDGVLSDAEKLAMKQHLQTIATEKSDVDKQYSSVYNNADLIGNAKTNLKSSYDDYNVKYSDLVKIINDILNKVGIIDSTDQNKLNTGFSNYRTSSGVYSQRVNEAIDSIASKKADDAETNSKKYTEAQIKVVNDAISLKVSQTEYDNNKNEVSNKFSEIKQTTDSINLSVNNLENNTSINMLPNSNFAMNPKYDLWYFWQSNHSANGCNWYLSQHGGFLQGEGIGLSSNLNQKCTATSQSVGVEFGETYTLSLDLYVEQNVVSARIMFRFFDQEGNVVSENKYDYTPGDYGRISRSVKIENNRIKRMNILIWNNGATVSDKRYVVVFFNRVQLEKGSKDTSWKLSTTDNISSRISQIQVDAEGIKNTVEHINGDYTSKSQLTQTENKFEYKFQNSGRPNLIPNGRPTIKNHAGWDLERHGWFYKGHGDGETIGLANDQSGECFAWTKLINVKPNTRYTVMAKVSTEGNVSGSQVFVVGHGKDDWNYNQSYCFLEIGSGVWGHYQSFSFTTANNVHRVRLRVDNNGYIGDPNNKGSYVVWMHEFCMIEGEVENLSYRSSENQVYNNVTEIDSIGVKVTHDNGDYTLQSSQGMKRHRSNGDAKGDYHYLTQYIGFSGKDTVWVQLKDDFRGKHFTAYSVMSDTWEGSWDWGQPWVVQRFVTFVQTDNIDYANARVPVTIYRVDKNYKTDAYRKMPCAGILLVVG
ncbi:MAG: hypothetical protein ACRCX2_36120 [Paraclostridium sp.]